MYPTLKFKFRTLTTSPKIKLLFDIIGFAVASMFCIWVTMASLNSVTGFDGTTNAVRKVRTWNNKRSF